MYARAQENRLSSRSQSISMRVSMEAIGKSLSDRIVQALQFELDRIRIQKQNDPNVKWLHSWYIQTHFLRLIFNNYDSSVCKIPAQVTDQNMVQHLSTPTMIFISILGAWNIKAVSRELSKINVKTSDELLAFSQDPENSPLRKIIHKAFKKERILYVIDVIISTMVKYRESHSDGMISSLQREINFQENISSNLLSQTEIDNLIAKFPILLANNDLFYSQIVKEIIPILRKNKGVDLNTSFNERGTHLAKIQELMLLLKIKQAAILRNKINDLNACINKADISLEVAAVKEQIQLLFSTLSGSKVYFKILEKIDIHLEFLNSPVILNNNAEETYRTFNSELATPKKAALLQAYNLNAILVMKLAYLAMGKPAITVLEQENSLRQIVTMCGQEEYQKKLSELSLSSLDESYFVDSESVERLCYQIYLEKTKDALWKIKNNISLFGLSIIPITGSGNGLYKAIGQHISQDEYAIRARVAEVLARNMSQYQDIIFELSLPGQANDEYINDVRRGREARQLEIKTLMQLLQTTIIVIHPDGRMEHGDTLSQYTQNEPIFIYYNGVNHYDGLTKNSSGITGRAIFENLQREYRENREPFRFINNQLTSRDGFTRECFEILRQNDVPRCYQYFFILVIMAVHITSGIKNPRDRLNILDAILNKTTDTPLSNKILKSKKDTSRLKNPPWLAMYLPASDIKAHFPAAHVSALRRDGLLSAALSRIPPVVQEAAQGNFIGSPPEEPRPKRRWW